MRFVAIDVETANARFSSICQVGIVVFENGREIGADVLLLDPEEEFDDFNVEIHGIGPSHVQGAPNFAGIQSWLGSHMAGQIVVSHTHFDRFIGNPGVGPSFPPSHSVHLVRYCEGRAKGVAQICEIGI